MTIKKWEMVSSETVLKDKWIDVRADSCRIHDGSIIEPFYVLNYSDWVRIVAITPENEIVMIRQYRHGLGDVDWEIPAGQVDVEDGNAEATARRELLEETGYKAARFELVSTLWPNTANHSNRAYTFLALNAEKAQGQNLEPTEEIEVHLKPVQEVLDMVMKDEIQHAQHVSSILIALAKADKISLKSV